MGEQGDEKRIGRGPVPDLSPIRERPLHLIDQVQDFPSIEPARGVVICFVPVLLEFDERGGDAYEFNGDRLPLEPGS
jgi:hypothetical protein